MTTNELTFTIITADEGKELLYGPVDLNDSINGTDDCLYCDVKSYCDKKSLTKLKKKLGIESRRRIKYVITHTKEHCEFKPRQNKDITYTYEVFVDGSWEGAEPYTQPSAYCVGGFEGGMATTKHPYGDIFIALEKDPEETKKEKEMKKMKSQLRERLSKIIDKEKLNGLLETI